MYIENNYIGSIQRAYTLMDDGNSHDSDRLNPIHQYIGEQLSGIFNEDNFTVIATEYSDVEGAYYTKSVPIVVLDGNDTKLCVGFKFVTSNFLQNAINYFQGLLGESANIQTNNIKYAFVFIIPRRIRYRRNGGQIITYQNFKTSHLQKYANLYQLADFAHRPISIGCIVIDIDYETGIISPADLTNTFTEAFIPIFNQHLSMRAFFDKLTQFKDSL
ncbi:hypothetical protein [Dyadobacter sp. Leaf189]|uniref:hypothetical protein n=1 Tax=Dyadobacter sp. Leaf189 TaxID=1736295 RepID=UPI0006F8D5EE|nr:hypothetical protein [Dyadobacter sp. Leaf189]KQS27985.1 hypothetical protein ASG33_16445 [Dyadobacter sp. Leaf189]